MAFCLGVIRVSSVTPFILYWRSPGGAENDVLFSIHSIANCFSKLDQTT